jgi:hypothetical protein
MTSESDELAFLALGGRSVPYSHAVLIETANGWHVEAEDLPSDSCPFIGRRQCAITFDTWDGERYSGSVTVSYASEDAAYLLLTGVGELERSRREDPPPQDVGNARTSA